MKKLASLNFIWLAGVGIFVWLAWQFAKRLQPTTTQRQTTIDDALKATQ